MDKKFCVVCISGKAECVDGETEYFNGIEWKKICDYDNELVLQFNKDGSATLVQPIDYIVSNDREFYHVQNKTLDMKLTENHDVVYYTSKFNLCKKIFLRGY